MTADTPHWHVAQMNVGTLLHPIDDPRIADFVTNLDAVNALADASPGFVWRLQSESGNATDIQTGDDPNFIVNMSVWESTEALFAFVYKSAHRLIMARRREWFARPEGPYQVLWWIAAGHRPDVTEGLESLHMLKLHGPDATAFTFRQSFPPPSTFGKTEDLQPEPWCVGWR